MKGKPPSAPLRFALAVLVLSLAVVACSAFDSAPAPQACMDIPEGGCPGKGTVNCVDPTCSAIYTCEDDGGWSLSAACPVREAGVPDARPDVDLRRDADFDVPPGATGGTCGDLETPPDCNLSLALACPSDECCGCWNVYVCDDGGWNLWGACEEGGALVPNPPLGAHDH